VVGTGAAAAALAAAVAAAVSAVAAGTANPADVASGVRAACRAAVFAARSVFVMRRVCLSAFVYSAGWAKPCSQAETETRMNKPFSMAMQLRYRGFLGGFRKAGCVEFDAMEVCCSFAKSAAAANLTPPPCLIGRNMQFNNNIQFNIPPHGVCAVGWLQLIVCSIGGEMPHW
jgi:hypothetical protein